MAEVVGMTAGDAGLPANEAQHAAQAVARNVRCEVGGEQVGGVAAGVTTGLFPAIVQTYRSEPQA